MQVLVWKLLHSRRILLAEPDHQYLHGNLEENLLDTVTWKLYQEL